MWSEIGRGRNTAELSRKHVARSADGLIAEKVTSLPSSHDSLFIGEDEAVNLGAIVRLAMGEVDYQAFVGIETCRRYSPRANGTVVLSCLI